ncbi:MAG: hypothetical protein ACFN4U_04010 [Candidatus Absconditicoccaceae bacterium]
MEKEKILVVHSLQDAQILNPELNSYVVILGYTPRFTGEWKNCEGSSLPSSLDAYKGELVVIVKITDRKVKLYAFPAGKSYCSTETYRQVLKRI